MKRLGAARLVAQAVLVVVLVGACGGLGRDQVEPMPDVEPLQPVWVGPDRIDVIMPDHSQQSRDYCDDMGGELIYVTHRDVTICEDVDH